MDQSVKEAIYRAVDKEPFSRTMNMELVSLELGHSIVEIAQANRSPFFKKQLIFLNTTDFDKNRE